MDYSMLEVAFSGLMHDIGKFYQRTKMVSDLTEKEKLLTPESKLGYNTHLHSGYTSRFFHEYLHKDNEYEALTSSHHIDDKSKFATMIRKADHIASSIDRKDEEMDYEENNKKSSFQQVRLSSVINEVDFGKKSGNGTFPLQSFKNIGYPVENYILKDKRNSVEEYETLFNEFIKDLKSEHLISGDIDKYTFDRLYAMLFEYTTLVPASTYEGNKTYVSLFDHLKLTSAIASCLYLNDTEDEKFIILHSCINDDSLRSGTTTCKSKESMILTSVKYISELINNLLLLKFNNLNNADFMDLFGKSVYVKTL